MEQHDLVQGSPEWLAYRATHRNASDAPAMMGISPYKTRNQLLHEVYTGLSAEVDAGTQARFDDGHRFEALARERAEDLVGEGLYPVVGSLGVLSASFDGLTICDDVVWEHKTLNDEIRAAETGADLGMHYRIQVEQQLLVAGAEKCLFLATKWDANDNLVEERHFWFGPDLQLRADIVAGWQQFEADVAAYVPFAHQGKPQADAIMALPALMVQIRGEVANSNLPAYRAAAEQFIADINTDLQTEDDFANAEATIKFCDAAERNLKAAKAAAMGQTASIDELMRTFDLLDDQFRGKRLMLSKLVERRKVEIKETVLAEAKVAYAEHVAALEAELRPIRLFATAPDFAGVMKNKRTLASLHDAVDTLLAGAKIATNTTAADYRAKQAWCAEHASAYKFLLMDLQQIIAKPTDDFQLLVNSRIAEHQRAEAKKAEELRVRIAAEEQVKAEAAAADAARAAKDEADRVAREVAQVAPLAPVSAQPELARQSTFYAEPAPRAAAQPARLNPAAAWPPAPRPATEIIDAVIEGGMTDDDILAFGAEHDMEVDELIPRFERFIADARAGALAVAA